MKTTDPITIGEGVTLMSAPADSVAELNVVYVTNNDVAAATIELYIVPPGQNVSSQSNRVAVKSLAAGVSRRFLEGVRLNPGSELFASTVASGVNVIVGWTEAEVEDGGSDADILSDGGV